MKIEIKKLNVKNKSKGITLVALVVTIIILLILSGVAINLSIGEEGIFKRAVESTEKMSEAQEKEKIELAVINSKIDNIGTLEISGESLKKTLEEQFKNKEEITFIDNNDGSYMLKINNTDREYYINNDGEIIDKNNMLAISTEEELKKFRDEVNNGNTYEGKYVYLENNIVLEEAWIPIGYNADNNVITFNGIFDGKNSKVSNININNPQKLYQGLFAKIGKNASIKNVKVEGNILGGKYVAGIVGYNEGTIKNCGNEVNISNQYDKEGDADSKIGGIAGQNYNGIINGCYNKGKIQNTRTRAGGITGDSVGGEIKNCYNLGEVLNSSSGGIAGVIENTIISNTYNNININNSGGTIGGIVGGARNKFEIKNCYNIGNILTAGDNIGGIVGVIVYGNGKIENCYNKANIGGDYSIGGIVGLIGSTANNVNIKNCYHYGDIETIRSNNGPITGIISQESYTNNCQWYTENQEYYNNIIGRTSIKYNENIDMKTVLEVINNENYFVLDNDNNPKLYWE